MHRNKDPEADVWYSHSPSHCAAIVKALYEGNDPITHFGSLLGYQAHRDSCERLGLITIEGQYSESLTDLGRSWYEVQDMHKLSKGRANDWHSEMWSKGLVPEKTSITKSQTPDEVSMILFILKESAHQAKSAGEVAKVAVINSLIAKIKRKLK